jgi:hypothetical protein
MFMDPLGLCTSKYTPSNPELYSKLRKVTSQAAASAGLYVKGGTYEPIAQEINLQIYNTTWEERLNREREILNAELGDGGDLVHGGPWNPLKWHDTAMWILLDIPMQFITYPVNKNLDLWPPFGHSHDHH